MAAGSLKQFGILFKKNWQLQRRKKVETAVEIGLPWFMCAMIVLMRVLIDSTDITDPTIWVPFHTEQGFPQLSNNILNSNEKWSICYAPNTSTEITDVIRLFLNNTESEFISKCIFK